MTLLFGADHAGYQLKRQLLKKAQDAGYSCEDLGCHSDLTPVDYPIITQALTSKMQKTPEVLGILVCGSGIGMCMAANRHSYIRAALCITTQMAELARTHNNANVLCLGARITTPQEAHHIFQAFLTTPFAQDVRHIRRLQQFCESEIL